MKTARAVAAHARRWFARAGRGGVETWLPGDVTARLRDVWGQDRVVARVREDLVLLQRPGEIERRGGRVPGGLLLWGPPGTGKSLIAAAVAGETGTPYVRVDPGALTGGLRVRSLVFRLRRLAARHGGVVVFLDQVDALDEALLRSVVTGLARLARPREPAGRTARPAYRVFVILAAGRPDALDEALLRRARIDRVYEVGRPSGAGRARTFQGVLGKVPHQLTAGQIDWLAAVTPHATAADIEDLVNEALITAVRAGRDVITWPDMLRALRPERPGPPAGAERHALAVHEACHAVVAYATRPHRDLGVATVESGACHLGPIGTENPRWRSECEARIMIALASVAGERLFFGEDGSSGVAGDLHAATHLTALMESRWGMGAGLASLPALQELGIAPAAVGDRVEAGLARLLERTGELLRERRREVLCLAHALETHGTLHAADVIAVIRAAPGPLIDGTPYASDAFHRALEDYHRDAARAHLERRPLGRTLPAPPDSTTPRPAPEPAVLGPGRAPEHAAQGPGAPGSERPHGAAGSRMPRRRPDFVPWEAARPRGQRPVRPETPAATRAGAGATMRETAGARDRTGWRRTAGRVWAVAASALVLVLLSLLTAPAVTGILNRTPGLAEAGGRAGVTVVGAGGDAVAEPGVPPAGLLFVMFVVIVAVVVGAGLAYAAVRRMRAAQLAAERERDQAQARAQFLAAALDPATAMRLLGYDRTGRT